jgi:hypothetical protein
MNVRFTSDLSLAPGFSPVCQTHTIGKLFQQLLCLRKPLKRLDSVPSFYTWLKPGANEKLPKRKW